MLIINRCSQPAETDDQVWVLLGYVDIDRQKKKTRDHAGIRIAIVRVVRIILLQHIVVVRAIARPLHAAHCTLLSAQISGHYIRLPSAGEYKSVTRLAYDNVFVASRLVYEKSAIHCEYVDLCVKLHITILRTEMFSRKLRGVSR